MTKNPADLVFNNGKVAAPDAEGSGVLAVAIRDGRFAAARTAEQVTQSSSKCGDTASSSDRFQNVTSQFVAEFQTRGCALSLAEELAQKVTGEVKSRVGEVLRRPGLNATWISGVIEIGDLRLDLERHILWRGSDEVHLSPKEFDLLALMMKNADVLLPHVKLLRSVWGLEYGGELEYLRTIVCSLRKKIERNPAHPEYIVNEPAIGYRFRNPAETRTRRQGTDFQSAHYPVPPPAAPMNEWGGAR